MIHPYYFSRQKRIFDFFGALILLIILFKPLLILGLIIFATIGWPIIFTQSRTGRNGEIFTLFKFRTMKKNAEQIKHLYKNKNEAAKPMFKIHNDPRFVGIGKFLSRSGLDELPQLLNILKGEMSFVGPRPLPVKEASSLSPTWKKMREQVRPGVFSEWSLAYDRHSNLKKWKSLEEKTLKKGSTLSDLSLMVKVILIQLSHLF